MSEEMVCPCCGADVDVYQGGISCHLGCCFQCELEDFDKLVAAMELARATVVLENAMEPLNSGKLKMGEALPTIQSAMVDQKACEKRVIEVFK